MSRLGTILRVLAIASLSSAAYCGSARAQEVPAARPSYHVVHGWPELPEGRVLGSVAGCAADSRGNVFVFHRNERKWPASGQLATTPIASPVITLFDGKSGKVLAEWGENQFAMPHGLAVDSEDNVWLTDVALQQVYKYSHDGKLLMTLGQRGIAGNDAAHFNLPTEVAVSPDGSFYVSDGYRNTRVIKFSPEGKFLFQWGRKGAGPGEFDLPHAVKLDEKGRVYVADRSNARVQIFDSEGSYLTEWKGAGIGRPYDIALAADGTAFIADGGDQPDAPPDRSTLVVVRPDGSVRERVGRWGNYDGQFESAHCVAVAKDGSVYVGDIRGGRIQKFAPGAP